MKVARLLLAVPLLHACAATVDHAPISKRSSPLLLTASPESRVGGEAGYEGELRIQGNCIMVVAGDRAALPIFDTSVSLTEAGDAILDSRTGNRIAIGERLRAGAAHLRRDGEGWSRSDIEASIGVKLPDGCGDTIVRLGRIKPISVTEAFKRPGDPQPGGSVDAQG